MCKRSSMSILFSLFLFLVASSITASAATSFTMTVPGRVDPITSVQLVIDVQGTTVPTITLINTAGGTFTFTPADTTLTSAGVDIDRATPLLPPGTFTMTRHRFSMLLSGCSPATSTVTWTISVPVGFSIVSACAVSFWRTAGCLGTAVMVNGDAAAGPPATISGGGPGFAGACERYRLPVDAVMVLDKSGSMAGSTLGSSPRPKIEALRAAVKDMADVWTGLRSIESGSFRPSGPPNDQVGVALFQSDADWWSVTGTGLSLFMTSGPLFTDANLVTITPGTSTSIGDGVFLADGVLNTADPLRRRVILVMSDGYQNTDRMLGINAANRVVTYNPATPAVTTELPNQSKYQIYSVTVGTDSAVSPTINQNIATKTGGFYINTETEAQLLRPFFLELLQNFLKFNSVETVRMTGRTVAAGSPFTAQVPITSTTEGLSINLMWPEGLGRIRVTATPPGGAPISQIGSTSIHINQRLPLPAPYRPGDPWTITVELLAGEGTIPFDLTVLTDDHGLESDQSIVAGDYVPGAPIHLETRVNVFGKLVKGIGSNPGDKMVVELLRPGVGVGDLLSDSTASTNPPQPADQTNAALSKLQNTLQSDPSKLIHAQETIPLLDNGNAANGDALAGDGIYSALYTPQIPGHYNFLFGAEGASNDVGRFSRQQLKTVYVRPVPDPPNTQVQSSVRSDGNKNTLVINMTPRTKFNNRMGPGFANYFWFTSPGQTAFKARDNLNGTYTAELPFSGVPPDVTIHFIDVPIIIVDSVTPDKLPVPLDNSNVVKHVPPPSSTGSFKRWGLSLHAGISIPHGNFNAVFDPGPNFAIDLEYRVNPTFSLEAIYGLHHFNGATIGNVTVGNLNVHQFSFNGKVYGSSSPVRPFFNFGGGAYTFGSGGTRAGLNIGAGVQFDVTSTVAAEAMYDFHNVFTSGSSTRFSAFKAGFRFRF
ncbi:MAG: hypothetical protein QOH41_2240 [Blastocatellia bacterium]|nr:hypothetical protein [Blastocatellia bacterium]